MGLYGELNELIIKNGVRNTSGPTYTELEPEGTKTTGGKWVTPTWDTMWFPHAFKGVMEQLQHAVATGADPMLTVEDNVKTVALIEAGYRSMAEGRVVKFSEIKI